LNALWAIFSTWESTFFLTSLSAVSQYTRAAHGEADPHWLAAVALHFAEGVLVIEAEPDTDEVAMRLAPAVNLAHWAGTSAVEDVSARAGWSGLLGASCGWRWHLTNQQGYASARKRTER
jgi:hypothetical protein